MPAPAKLKAELNWVASRSSKLPKDSKLGKPRMLAQCIVY